MINALDLFINFAKKKVLVLWIKVITLIFGSITKIYKVHFNQNKFKLLEKTNC